VNFTAPVDKKGLLIEAMDLYVAAATHKSIPGFSNALIKSR
jgi:hypothetical protein